jgi:transposase
MSKRIFTKEQIETLLQNPNVAGCSEKSISWSKDFKIFAVAKYHEGSSSLEIFRQARLDIDMIGQETPKNCMRRWRKIFKNKGEAGLNVDGRGRSKMVGRPKSLANLTDEEKLKRLKVEVDYLREENRFLAKLRKERLN